MDIGINGGATLQITDHKTNGVASVECCNLVTNYGLQHLLAPKELRDKCATHFCLGYRTTDPSYDDIIIPGDYTAIEILNERTTQLTTKSVRCVWQHVAKGLDNLPVGTKFNHMYLAYKDEDGVFWPITSLMFKQSGGELYEYVHDNTLSLYVTYYINLDISAITVHSDFTDISFAADQTVPAGVYYREMKGLNTYRELTPYYNEANPAYIEPGTGESLVTGSWSQNFKLTSTAYSYSGAFSFRIGFANWTFTLKNYRATASYNLALTVSQPPEEYLLPSPVTSVVISPPTYINTTEDQRRVKISARPYQWVDIYYKQWFVSSHYVDSSGFFYRSSYLSEIANDDGTMAYPYDWFLSSGNKVRMVSRTANGVLETLVDTPDLQADDLIAIWWTSPTNIRAVSRFNDTVALTWAKDTFSDDGASQTRTNINTTSGKCTTLYDEVEQTYYCDIDMSTYDPQRQTWLGYSVTDAAGNVYDGLYGDKAIYIRNYLPNMSYEQCVNSANIRPIGVTIPNDGMNTDVNDYHYSLRLISAEIK